jgi:hypothetical protein
MKSPFSAALYLTLGAIGAYIAYGSYQKGRGYPVTTAEAERLLGTMDFSQSMLTGFSASLSSESVGAERNLRWTFSRGGKGHMASCVVSLTSLNPQQTEAALACAPDGQPADPEMAKAGAGLIQSLFEEHMSAALERRPLDTTKLGRAMMAQSIALQPVMARRMSGPPN